ncbi:unnamed protein product [Auanema sp. JU1783]|nr:unnamed protein product [Auanema sp. JU1783]
MSFTTIARGIVCGMNLLMLLVAAAVIGLACWIRWDDGFEYSLRHAIKVENNGEPLRDIKDDMRTWITVSYWVIMGFAIACVIIGFVGFLASCLKSRCFLILYFIAMVIVIILEIAVGIRVIVAGSDIHDKVNSYVYYSYYLQSQQDIQAITGRYDCCGVAGQATFGCSAGQKTCTAAVWDRLNETLIIFGSSMIAVIVLQIVVSVLTIPIFAHRKREESTY